MIVLGLEAAGGGAGAAVVDGSGVRGSAQGGPGARPAAALIPLVEAALRAAGLGRADLEGVAVGVGPGSYAGVRAAVTSAKAIAWAAGLPLLGVGSLQALCAAAGAWPGPIFGAWDARRGRVYAAAYAWRQDEPQEEMAPALLGREEFRTALRVAGPCLLAGTGVSAADIAGLAGARLAPPVWGAALAAAVAHLGRAGLLRGRRSDPLGLVPVYAGEPALGPAPRG